MGLTLDRAPLRQARVGGLLYLAIILLGLGGEAWVRNVLLVSGDPAATAANISASPGLWRAGIIGDLLMHVLDVPLILILYLLLKPVSKPLAQLATLLNLVQTAVLAANKLNLLVPLFLLTDGAGYLAKAFSPEQLQTLSYLAIKAHGFGFGIGLIFFGVASLLRGQMLFRSGYFPKALGLLMGAAGLCYLINSLALLAEPAWAGALFPAILVPAFIGELALCLWLLLKGVDREQWERRVSGR